MGAIIGCVACPLAAGFVRVVPFRWYRSLADDSGGRAATPRVQQFSRGVTIAARRGPVRVRCLAESVALATMLRAGGFGAQLVVGVADPRGTFRAHAWVTVGDQIVGSTSASTRGFATLAFSESE